ncbi:MAG: hypothetical protein ACI4WX_17205 [Aristaeellaceae bacterium]
MAYLMTHSLLSAWLHSMKDNPYDDATTKDTSKEDFLMVLRRAPTPTSEAMQNGIDFENLVTGIITGCSDAQGGSKHPWFDAASKVSGIVRGGQLQHVASKRVIVDGMKLLLYGRLDALKAGSIYDIKFSKSYDRGKYFDSTQHPMYMELVPKADSFTYLVSDGTSVWTEKYRRDETASIYPTIKNFLCWLYENDLMQTYKRYWGERPNEG